MDYKKYPTDRFECHKCHAKKMYPCAIDGKIMGFVCFYCDEINYPIKEKIEMEQYASG